MNKSELIRAVAERGDLSMKVGKEAVDCIFDLLIQAILDDDRIEIRGFGSIMNKKYDAYVGRNPKSGDKINVPEKRLPFFKVGKELRQRVDSADDF